ncbi:hypothetical protein MMC18_007127 [Xylographa bjoerkii]|nr:hypothetical protein [Xylographa bjoerkii]
MQLKNIAIVGPGGNVGSAIIAALLKTTQFHLTAIIRPTSTYSSPSSQVITLTADFNDPLSLVTALHNQDALVCCVPGGATAFPPQKLLIDAAIAAKVKLFFADEFVSDILSPHFEIFPTAVVGEKAKIRMYLEEKAAKGEIAWTALNGGPFFDMWLMAGPAGFSIPTHRATIYGSGNNLACWTPLPVIALAVTNMLSNPLPIVNRGILICSVKGVTQNAILAALEAEMGETFEVEYVDVKKIREEAHAALARGEYKTATRGLTINAQYNEEESAANFWGKVENELVDVNPVTVREAVREAMANWDKR